MKKSFLVLFMIIFLTVYSSCGKKDNQPNEVHQDIYYTISLYDGDDLIKEESVKENTEYHLDTPTKNHYEFLGWDDGGNLYTDNIVVNSNIKLTATYELIPFINFELSAPEKIYDGKSARISLKYEDLSSTTKIAWSSSDDDIAYIENEYNSSATIIACGVGKVIITATSKADSTIAKSIELNILGSSFDIEYNLSDFEEGLLDEQAIKSFNTENYPIVLPILEKENFIFMGWTINNSTNPYKIINKEDDFKEDIILSPVWVYPNIDINCEQKVLKVDDQINLSIIPYDLIDINGYNYESSNNNILTVDDNGLVTAIKEGYAEIKVSVKNYPSVNLSIGLLVNNSESEFSEIVDYLASIVYDTVVTKDIMVYGWQKTYHHDLLGSVMGYLFEDLVITENIAPITNTNRPGTKRTVYYICVHDTGDAEYTAYDWSMTVYNYFNKQNNSAYNASYQYVTGNDGIYHNIPDDEVSWHAGDGTSVKYGLLETGVSATTKYPLITIGSDGYYYLNGQKSKVVAPTKNGSPCTTDLINDAGIRCVIQDGKYYLGKTWYSKDYNKVANYGGNNNSIGIESCINYGSNIYYTWMKTAKLVGKLLDENHLTKDDIVPHHYFSGKNCPQTMRTARMWDYFKDLCMSEYQMLKYVQSGYSFSFKSNNPEYLNDSGYLIKWPVKNMNVSFNITISKGGKSQTITLSTMVLGQYAKR